MNCDPEFDGLLKDYHPEALHSSEDTIYGLKPDFSLAYFNQGWTEFASRNGGEPSISRDWRIGRNIRETIPAELQPLFCLRFDRCLQENQIWEYEYECSSPDQYRLYIMRIYPLAGEGLLVVNSPIYQFFHHGETREPREDDYRTPDDLVIQCCHCRRVRRRGIRKAWDFVPDWFRKCPENTSHGICEPCFGFYYGSRLTRS